ncbi:hypothetical protein Fleli_3014 [Bernardetia litoralis DSM 6794]|uniref:HNH domain-containing protein n=1 Tax=Bernardetia litoralis (strain ATCC 23117 / DSM 6794 / NBRC 15988 / NCIMB 1366 / Fx l1 / Sio-4) TaxID=880071 RepID=I4AN20_BERLS|nr:HNH endonuclease [Bernardetia litoralis]AFM05355.1 hypothetical protein Fleli_3014 [Bernardetia litoralis DSM 6794]
MIPIQHRDLEKFAQRHCKAVLSELQFISFQNWVEKIVPLKELKKEYLKQKKVSFDIVEGAKKDRLIRVLLNINKDNREVIESYHSLYKKENNRDSINFSIFLAENDMIIKKSNFKPNSQIDKINQELNNIGITQTLEEILLFPPSEIDDLALKIKKKNGKLPDLISLYSNFSLTNNECFGTLGTKYNAYQLVEDLNINVCPYCNRNFIKNLNKSGKRICEMDHFYPKSEYPFLGMSFYNLIPSCKTCNQTFKETKLVSVNPYSKIEEFSFGLKIENSRFYYDKDGFSIDYDKARKVLGESFTRFKIEELYDQHKDQILELIQKQVTYPDSYIDELFQKYEGTFFRNREDVIRHLSNGIMEEENFHLRPLSKLTHDIAKELGLLD